MLDSYVKYNLVSKDIRIPSMDELLSREKQNLKAPLEKDLGITIWSDNFDDPATWTIDNNGLGELNMAGISMMFRKDGILLQGLTPLLEEIMPSWLMETNRRNTRIGCNFYDDNSKSY